MVGAFFLLDEELLVLNLSITLIDSVTSILLGWPISTCYFHSNGS